MGRTLAAFGLFGKPYVANSHKWHCGGMRRKKKIHWERIKSPVQRVFVVRVNEEMALQVLSDNGLAKRCSALGMETSQSSVSRITGGRQDPSLEQVDNIANALGVPAWQLFKPSDAAAAQGKVIHMPGPPSMLGGHAGHKISLRKKRQRK